MIYVSLSALLEGIADQLDDAVHMPPEGGGDSYQRGQLAAAAEILRNLADRVMYRPDTELEERVRRLLGRAVGLGVAVEGEGRRLLEAPAPAADPDPVTNERRRMAALVELQNALAASTGSATVFDPVRDELRTVIAWHLERELEGLRR
jgi:hypothetical protein